VDSIPPLEKLLGTDDNGTRAGKINRNFGVLVAKFNELIKRVSGVNFPPIAAFTITQPTPMSVLVNGTSSTDSDGQVLTWVWDFGDGTTATGVTPPAHVYAKSGTYPIRLTVTDNLGETADVVQTAVAVALPTTSNEPPTAAFTTAVAADGVTVTVDASASSDVDGTIVSYAWSWGDGTTSTGVKPAPHTYASSGSRAIKLVVTDNGGATGTLTKNVTVSVPTSGGGSSATAVKSPWKLGSLDQGLPSNVAIYKARTLIPSGALELQTLINALPATGGIIDISGQEVNISTFGNGSASGAYAAKWQGLIGGITNGQFDNQLLVGHNVMSAAIVAAIAGQQTAYQTSGYAAVRMSGGKQPFYWMGVHMIGADQGQIAESSRAQVTPIPARYKGVDFNLSGTGAIIQNSLFEGVNSASGSVPPWEVGALDFRRSSSQVLRRVEVSGVLPIGSKSRPDATTADPYNRGWKRSGGIQFNADKSPILEDVSLHDALVSGLTFSIAGSGNNGSNNTENIKGTRLYLENNSAYGFACINNEVVLGPIAYDRCVFRSPGGNPHIKIANNSSFGSVAPNIPTDQYVVNEPTWSGGGGGGMFHMAISTAAQTSYPKVVVGGKTLTASTTTGKDPSQFYYVQKV